MKKKVGILFGGKSAEHEISLLSAKNIFEAIDKTKFEPILVGIDKSGKWMLSRGEVNDASRFLLNADNPALISLNAEGRQVALLPENRGLLAAQEGEKAVAENAKPAERAIAENAKKTGSFADVPLDVVFPILHGPFGEDGTIQGFLKLADIPFVGPGVLGSAVGMDKDAMKRLLRDAGLPIGKFLTVKSHEKAPSFEEVKAALGTPFFIKPANMGSSVGISKVRQMSEYAAAVKDAFQYDTKIVIEEFISGREIECAVLGNEEPKASVPGEIIPTHDFYSYDAKYIDTQGATLEIPAKLDEATKRRVQELAVKVFQVLCCEGLSRVDFFLKESGEIIVNEINTMPGFTKMSMYPKLFEASGISYSELITRLIELAISRFEKERALKTSVV